MYWGDKTNTGWNPSQCLLSHDSRNNFLMETNSSLCHVSAIINNLAVQPSVADPLFIFENSTPLSRDVFCKNVLITLKAGHVDLDDYSASQLMLLKCLVGVSAISTLYSYNLGNISSHIPNPCTVELDRFIQKAVFVSYYHNIYYVSLQY